MAILSGDWEDYHSNKEVLKDLDFTYEHYSQHHLTFDGLKNIIATKELFFGKALHGTPELFYQMTGNLGAFGNWTLDRNVNICILSDSTLRPLTQIGSGAVFFSCPSRKILSINFNNYRH